MPDNKDPKKDPNYDYFQAALKRNEQALKDKARLYYYTQKFKEPLKKKNPKVYEELMSTYEWKPNNRLWSKTRVLGASKFSKENPGFDLKIDEQKNILGKDWDDYLKLKTQYGKELDLFGENEDSEKPETWKVGARHVASFNPITYNYTIEPPTNSFIKNRKSDFKYEIEYDPSQQDPYISNLMYNKEQDDSPLPQKVLSYYDNNTQEKTEHGTVFVQPGRRFKKINEDGSEELISDREYFKLKPINGIVDPNKRDQFLSDLGQ